MIRVNLFHIVESSGGGYIFSSGHKINPVVKLENFLTMRKPLEEYGKYPLKMN